MWSYADWITLDDQAARLTRLRLHIVEVSQHIQGTSTRGQSVTAVDQRYLQGLRDDEKTLTGTVSRPSIARNKARFL
jgi:hypothetical protein